MSSTPNWETMYAAFKEAESTNRRIGAFADACADLALSNLRRVDAHRLTKLKHALKVFSTRTGRWNS